MLVAPTIDAFANGVTARGLDLDKIQVRAARSSVSGRDEARRETSPSGWRTWKFWVSAITENVAALAVASAAKLIE